MEGFYYFDVISFHQYITLKQKQQKCIYRRKTIKILCIKKKKEKIICCSLCQYSWVFASVCKKIVTFKTESSENSFTKQIKIRYEVNIQTFQEIKMLVYVSNLSLVFRNLSENLSFSYGRLSAKLKVSVYIEICF